MYPYLLLSPRLSSDRWSTVSSSAADLSAFCSAEAVTEAFLRLHDKGLVYKSSYLVNWSPNLQTAVSDLEVVTISQLLRNSSFLAFISGNHHSSIRCLPTSQVDYTEEAGRLYTFAYPLADSEDSLPVATTRPETILGDTAVAVNPEDDRFKRFVGRECVVPLSGGRSATSHLPRPILYHLAPFQTNSITPRTFPDQS